MAINANTAVTIWTDSTKTTPVISIVPQTFKWDLQAVDYEAGRVASGDMERNMVNEKRKVEFTFPPMSAAKWQQLMAAISGIAHAQFYCTIPDLLDSSFEYSGWFYCGDRSIDAYSWGMDIWTNGSVNFIEV